MLILIVDIVVLVIEFIKLVLHLINVDFGFFLVSEVILELVIVTRQEVALLLNDFL